MLELSFSFKLDWGSYIVIITYATSKKMGASIHEISFS